MEKRNNIFQLNYAETSKKRQRHRHDEKSTKNSIATCNFQIGYSSFGVPMSQIQYHIILIKPTYMALLV